jgi:hypothetical protein
MWQFRSQAPPPDNERIRKVIEEMLGVLGHEIVGRASTATASVAEARRHSRMSRSWASSSTVGATA